MGSPSRVKDPRVVDQRSGEGGKLGGLVTGLIGGGIGGLIGGGGGAGGQDSGMMGADGKTLGVTKDEASQMQRDRMRGMAEDQYQTSNAYNESQQVVDYVSRLEESLRAPTSSSGLDWLGTSGANKMTPQQQLEIERAKRGLTRMGIDPDALSSLPQEQRSDFLNKYETRSYDAKRRLDALRYTERDLWPAQTEAQRGYFRETYDRSYGLTPAPTIDSYRTPAATAPTAPTSAAPEQPKGPGPARGPFSGPLNRAILSEQSGLSIPQGPGGTQRDSQDMSLLKRFLLLAADKGIPPSGKFSQVEALLQLSRMLGAMEPLSSMDMNQGPAAGAR